MSRRRPSQSVLGQLVPSIPNSYTERTSRPIYALIYLLGFLVFYEIGIFFIQPDLLAQPLVQPEGQVVAFYWVRMVIQFLGFSTRMTWVAAPGMVIVILLALQITSKTPWRVKPGDFVLMAGECLLLAVPLIVLSLLLNRAISEPNAAVVALNSNPPNRLLIEVVTGIGAGIYEELIFRLALICLLMLLFQDILGCEKKTAVFWSVIISAVTFSIHHHFFYANGQFYRGDSFTIGKFLFRALAGVYFAVLYAVRGFGVTAGTHAFYNVLAAFLRMVVFVIQAE